MSILLQELKRTFFERLEGIYPDTEIQSFFFMLTQHYLELTRLNLALDPRLEISNEKKLCFDTAVERLQDHEPIQHILGETEFYGYIFKITKDVLIPRPETEELVSWILDDFQDSKTGINILDIGTGSGCIPISLARQLSTANVHSWDISARALDVARLNAETNQVKVNFKLQDILEVEHIEQPFDVIVSNPPYVRELEKIEMHLNVVNHEPAMALYVEDGDPLLFYKKITELAATNLQAGGCLYFEINQYLGKESLELVEGMGFEAVIKKDIFGNNRMIKGVKI